MHQDKMFFGNSKNTILNVKQQGNAQRCTLSAYTKRTLGVGNLKDAIQLPEGSSIEDWHAVNTVDFYNELVTLYGLVAEDAAKKYNKPGEGFPSGYEYRWADGVNIIRPMRCSAPEYVDYVMTWINNCLDDEAIFPITEDEPFPDDFLTYYVPTILKRLFRVCAIIYHRHYQVIENLDAVAHLNTCFKHFMFYCFQFNLLDDKETVVLQGFCDRLLEEFKKIDGKGAYYDAAHIAARAPKTVVSVAKKAPVPGVLGEVPHTEFFLSHHKAAVAGEVLLLHQELCRELNIKPEAGFLDSNDLRDLNLLLKHVASTKVLVLLQTEKVLSRPWVLLELKTAIESKIPIVCVEVQGKGYDHDATKTSLSGLVSFEGILDQAALDELKSRDTDLNHLREQLLHSIPAKISLPFSASAPKETRAGMIKDIVKAIQTHTRHFAGATMVQKKQPLINHPKSPLDQTLTGHTGAINSVSFSFDSKKLASGSADMTVMVWDVLGRLLPTLLKGHTNDVYSVSYKTDFTGTENIVASGSQDGTARIWDVSSSKCTKVLHILAPVRVVAYSPDGNQLAAGCDDGVIRFWQTSNYALTKTIKNVTQDAPTRSMFSFPAKASVPPAPVYSACYSPDGKVLITGSTDKVCRVWNLKDFTLTRTLLGHSEAIFTIAFAPNSKLFATGSGDRVIKVWDATSLSILNTFDHHGDHITGLSFSADSNHIVSSSKDKTVMLRKVDGSSEIRQLCVSERLVKCVTFSPDSLSIAFGGADNTVKLCYLGVIEE